MLNDRPETGLAEDIGSEPLLSVLLLQGLLPVGGSELKHAALRPGRQQAEEVTQVSLRLDAVELAGSLAARRRSR
jgi:hypothetical protein